MHGRPLPELGIRPVVVSKVGGTTPASESLGSKTEALNRAYAEEEGISNMTHGCVPGGARNFVQHLHHLVGKVRVDYVETPCECMLMVLKLQRVL